MTNTVYYLTGMDGRLNLGLGEALVSRGFEVQGRELVGEFKRMGFQQRLELVISYLRSRFWNENSRVIANSFGAYLFLHAQAEMPPFVGSVILLSPIIGEFSNVDLRKKYIPPRPKKLTMLAESGKFPTPNNCHVHVGSDDWQSNPKSLVRFCDLVGMPSTVVPNSGHHLPKEYVSKILSAWSDSE